ncbi:MAG: hypothetical protein J6N21_23645 [Butyrivibrio sp.]|nr:hypothetical protein [Butyrivibrio sp.]MBP3199970.1 hypothetical protein [Butyrivibrio sp.]
MKINKEIIKQFLEEALNDNGEEFDKIEADYEFDFEDFSDTCSEVRTSNFRVEISEYEIAFDEADNPITVRGKAYASYTVKGYGWEGDEEAGGYLECAEGDSGSDFSFSVDVRKSDFDESSLSIDVE